MSNKLIEKPTYGTEYELSNPTIITKYTMDRLLKEENSGNLIALYTFYVYTSTWQNTNQPKCTNSFVAEALNISIGSVKKYKSILINIGLIENIVRRNKEGMISGWYIKVNYTTKQTCENSKFPHRYKNPPGGDLYHKSYGLIGGGKMLYTNRVGRIEPGPTFPENKKETYSGSGKVVIEHKPENKKETYSGSGKVVIEHKPENKKETYSGSGKVVGTFFDIPTEPIDMVPKNIILTDIQKDILNKRNAKNKIDTSAFKTKNKIKITEKISDKINSLIHLCIIKDLEEYYFTEYNFSWMHAVRILKKTIHEDSRYSEIKDFIPNKFEIEEINLLYDIIHKLRTKTFFINKIYEDDGFQFSERLIYSLLFDKLKYENSIERLYKYYMAMINNKMAEIEKQQLNSELKNSSYISQINKG